MDLSSYLSFMDKDNSSYRNEIYNEIQVLRDTYQYIDTSMNELMKINKIICKDETGFCYNEYILHPNHTQMYNKNEVEIKRLEHEQEEVWNKRVKMGRLLREMYLINNINSVYKKANNLSRATKQRLEKELCGICCETHTVKHLVSTNCGHVFGKKCISEWIKHKHTHMEHNNELNCPCCRNNCVILTRYE